MPSRVACARFCTSALRTPLAINSCSSGLSLGSFRLPSHMRWPKKCWSAAYELLTVEGVTSAEHRDLYTAWTSGLADQQIANDPGGDRWLRLVDEASEMFLAHVKGKTPEKRDAQ